MVYLGHLIIYACFKYCVSSEITSISDITYTRAQHGENRDDKVYTVELTDGNQTGAAASGDYSHMLANL
jgi:hypothetical protein